MKRYEIMYVDGAFCIYDNKNKKFWTQKNGTIYISRSNTNKLKRRCARMNEQAEKEK